MQQCILYIGIIYEQVDLFTMLYYIHRLTLLPEFVTCVGVHCTNGYIVCAEVVVYYNVHCT